MNNIKNKIMEKDFYSSGYIAHGLMETKYALKELLTHCGETEVSDYHKELFNCLDKAVEILNK
tara:strand:+ start:312 stop:500 length:189 start_codon:yes stop_codon:yes gene_type:complete